MPSSTGRSRSANTDSNARERRVVPNQAGPSRQCARLKLERHEDVVGHVVLAAKTKSGPRRETKARIVIGVAQDDDCACTEKPAALRPSRTSADPIPVRWLTGRTAIGARPMISGAERPSSVTGEKRMCATTRSPSSATSETIGDA